MKFTEAKATGKSDGAAAVAVAIGRALVNETAPLISKRERGGWRASCSSECERLLSCNVGSSSGTPIERGSYRRCLCAVLDPPHSLTQRCEFGGYWQHGPSGRELGGARRFGFYVTHAFL